MTIHQDQPVLTLGASLDDARVAVLLVHGRGATAEDIQELARQLPTGDVAYVMPQAANNTWYPNSGFAPFEDNEPYLSSAMATLEHLVAEIEAEGVPPEQIVLGGFSQGACLTTEFAARHARRYGGLLVLSGALLGPADTPRDYNGSLDGTPVFIGGVDRDPWVTPDQLQETANALENLGAEVTLQIQSGSEHTIRPSEVEQAAAIIQIALHSQ
ncbi:MAG: alpha/beta fold hydrolase [Chloroflexi bacterium]|nr:alpha/beta fold hydrolase [Chloroflexota bacterium]